MILEIPEVMMGMGNLVYEYCYEDKKYQSKNYVRRSKLVQSIKVGHEVDVVVNTWAPKRAYLISIYSSN